MNLCVRCGKQILDHTEGELHKCLTEVTKSIYSIVDNLMDLTKLWDSLTPSDQQTKSGETTS